MISEAIARYPWLWTLAWQSTICLAAGLGGSYLLRRRAVRAHQILFLGLVAAVLIPAISQVVRRNQWGLFVAERAVPAPKQDLPAAQENLVIPAPTANEISKTPGRGENTGVVSAPTIARFNRTQAILALWLAASAALLLRLASQFTLGRRVVKRSEPIDEPRIAGVIEVAKDKLAIQAGVAVRAGSHIRSPVIWCWDRRPILLIPKESRPSTDGLDWVSIVCHELAHWKRRDHIYGLFVELMVCAVPWQPLMWWARRRLIALSEEACDDWVIASGQGATSYAKTLLGLIPQGQAGLVPGVVPSRKGLGGRIHRILHDACGNPYLGPRWTAASVTLALCVILGVSFAQTRPAARGVKIQNRQTQVEAGTAAHGQSAVDEETILLRLVDPNGHPVSGARVAQNVMAWDLAASGSSQTISRVNWVPSTGLSDRDGQVILEAKDLFHGWLKTDVYILHRERGIGAIHKIDREHLDETLPVVLKPVCRVHGVLESTGLAAIGMPLRRIDTSIRLNGADTRLLLACSSSKPTHDFDYLLPPGEYRLMARGSGSQGENSAFIKAPTEFKDLTITVPEGQSTLDLGVIDLRAATLADRIGRPAPEIGPMKAWKNGSAVTLAQLRGQMVWLHFGGNGSTAALFLPRLVELHEAYADKGLTVVAIYNCDSMVELEERWADVDQRMGPVPQVPFRIAIDGGEPTFYSGTNRERPGATYGRYDVTTMPMDVLIDPAGNVMGQPDSSHAKEALAQLLGGKKEAVSQVARGEQESSPPDGQPRFDAVYRLADGEILKRIAPPFIPERMEYYRSQNGRHPSGPDQLTFHWDGQLKGWGVLVGSGMPDTLGGILNRVLGLKSYEYEGPKPALDIELPGDWIVRNEVPQEVKLRALEELVARELGRKIRFEKRSVERNVVVATGKLRFPPSVAAHEGTLIHLYATDVDSDGAGGGTANSLGEFLRMLGDYVHMAVLDQTEQQEQIQIPYRLHDSFFVVGSIQDEQQRTRLWRVVLDHLTAQMGLQFEIRTGPVSVWYVTEQTGR